MIVDIEYKEILRFWQRSDMWGNYEHNQINPYTYDGVYDESIKFSIPTFYGFIENDKIVGVNSFYHTNSNECRSRGLYVLPEYRKNGIAETLLRSAIEINSDGGYEFIWSKPRVTAQKAYQNAGFSITSGVFNKNPDGSSTYHNNVMCKYVY